MSDLEAMVTALEARVKALEAAAALQLFAFRYRRDGVHDTVITSHDLAEATAAAHRWCIPRNARFVFVKPLIFDLSARDDYTEDDQPVEAPPIEKPSPAEQRERLATRRRPSPDSA